MDEIDVGNSFKFVLKFVGNIFTIFWKYPEKIINIWVASWVSFLLVTLIQSNISNFVLVALSGPLNITNAVGLGIPLFAFFIVFSKWAIPALWKLLENTFYRIFRKVRDEFIKAYDKIKELLASIGNKIKELMDKIVNFFNKAKDTATKTVKKVGKKIKKLFGSELQAIRNTHASLSLDLLALEKLAPESSEYIKSIGNSADAALDVALSSYQEDSSEYLSSGSWYNDISEIGKTMTRQFNTIQSELLLSRTYF